MKGQQKCREYCASINRTIQAAFYALYQNIIGAPLSLNDNEAPSRGLLEKTILAISIISLLMVIMEQSVMDFLYLRHIEKEQNCGNQTTCKDQELHFTFKPLEIKVGMQTLARIINAQAELPEVKPELREEADKILDKIGTLWSLFVLVWPLDAACLLFVITLDLARRVIRKRHARRDSTVMFAVFLLLGVSVLIRMVEMYSYFRILQILNDLTLKINTQILGNSTVAEMPVISCVSPPGAYFITNLMSLLLCCLQATFVLDYLDPT